MTLGAEKLPRLAAEASPRQTAQAWTGRVERVPAEGPGIEARMKEESLRPPDSPGAAVGLPGTVTPQGHHLAPGCWGRRLTGSQAPVSLA